MMSKQAAGTLERYRGLIDRGILNERKIRKAEIAANARGVDIEHVLMKEYHVPKKAVLSSLGECYGLSCADYDERLPVPPDIIEGLNAFDLSFWSWFPLAKDGNTVTIAVNNPDDPALTAQFEKYYPGMAVKICAALREDILWYINEYLHDVPGKLIGTERTGLAYWRNTMAHWRTKLASYRTDMAKARTDLAALRGGLGLVAISDAMISSGKFKNVVGLYALLFAGLSIAVYGLVKYLRLRHKGIRPPGHQTIVEVTSATIQFLENYHYIANGGFEAGQTKRTMLARLGDLLYDYSTILYPSPASRERTHLARERNVLAAQRTVAAAYRTIYARARTGLAFIRTGVSFISIGLGLMGYFGFGPMTTVDFVLITLGILMAADGALWYWPVRKEQAEPPRCLPD
ncbi:MAG: type II secretion protein [Nitrospirota bacterium]